LFWLQHYQGSWYVGVQKLPKPTSAIGFEDGWGLGACSCLGIKQNTPYFTLKYGMYL
jgi:hypothetical protein